MHINLHDYKYSIGDVAWIIDNLQERGGVIVDISGTTYKIKMYDNGTVETLNDPLLFPTKSRAEIYKNEFLITPTPSTSLSPTPTPSRTPKPSLTPSMTPSTSDYGNPNILDINNLVWNGIHGIASVKNNRLEFKSLSTLPSEHVSFSSSAQLVANGHYQFDIRFTEGTARYIIISLESQNGSQSISIGTRTSTVIIINHGSDIFEAKIEGSGYFSGILSVPESDDILNITVDMFSDSNYNNPAQYGTTYSSLGIFDGGGDASLKLHQLSNNKILVNGGFLTIGGESRSFVAALNQDGTYDPTYPIVAPDVYITAVATLPGGKYVLDGYFPPPPNSQSNGSYIRRFNDDGTLDETFIIADLADMGFAGINTFAVQSDGKLLVAGTPNDNQSSYPMILRLNLDGSIDETFYPELSPIYRRSRNINSVYVME